MTNNILEQPILVFFCLALIAICSSSIMLQDYSTFHNAFAQSQNNEANDSQSFENLAPIPDWVRNNTGLWTHGKMSDSQFMLGIRYLVANGISFLPEKDINSDLQKPIPSWVKEVATWWTNGSISDYDFLVDIQYLVNNGEIKLQPAGNQTVEQDSITLLDNFPEGKIKLDNTILDVQIANTSERMTEGLQFQKQLAYNQGMIFVFPESQIVAMWMKDMQFPLDMIWFDNNGSVVHIEKDLTPCNDTSPCQVYDGNRQNTKYVLEVTAGFADKFNVTEKSKIAMLEN